ncbi:hypothetical protein [Deinococcus knuensis]|uniref:hypothetical protein n=1 Tax=Deinococcus knuensis TaxID=1837380 RepID=UPI00166DCB1C|nr:hypothetical protein [Deinococcus knuensis]
MAGCLLFAGAGAHQPLFNPGSGTLESAFRVPQPSVSKVITVQGRAGGRDWYALTTGAGFRLDVAVFVSSACDATYRPRLWLVGPGVPVGAGQPDFVPDGWGAVGVSGPYWRGGVARADAGADAGGRDALSGGGARCAGRVVVHLPGGRGGAGRHARGPRGAGSLRALRGLSGGVPGSP